MRRNRIQVFPDFGYEASQIIHKPFTERRYRLGVSIMETGKKSYRFGNIMEEHSMAGGKVRRNPARRPGASASATATAT